jgi:hypothetical protein
MVRSLYHQGKSPRYPLDRRLGGPQSRYGRGGMINSFNAMNGLFNHGMSSATVLRSIIINKSIITDGLFNGDKSIPDLY